MAENVGFSTSRKGYNCEEVDAYFKATKESETMLRESYASMQEKFDALQEENSRLRAEGEKLREDCTALALIVKKLREAAGNEAQDDYKEKYEGSLEQIGRLEGEIALLKEQAENLRAQAAEKEKTADSRDGDNYGETASGMIAEVAAVVRKLEQDARRKADAIVAAAKLEQEKASLVSERVAREVQSLRDMLDAFSASEEAVSEDFVESLEEETEE